MCDICKDILVNFAISHEPILCPLRSSLYCSYCAQYGHVTNKCQSKPPKWSRKPIYVEQLIPTSDIIEYNITSKTLISPSNNISDESGNKRLLEIKDHDEIIIEFLKAKGIGVSKKMKENRNKLNDYATVNNYRLVFISSK
jgi:hypothetical protein